MCGWIDFERRFGESEQQIIGKMTDSLVHRGPDDRGLWFGERGGFGHRRLAVLDPARSRQPMIAHEHAASASDVVLIFTGEVYNFRALRKDLIARGRRFSTSGDTEVVLQSYLEWGADFVSRLAGMFSIAIWDGRIEQLLLIRDRLGIKPLYWFPLDRGLLFASEPKAILCHPDIEAAVDAEGLRQLFGLVRTPGHAVFSGMREVKPGHLLQFDADGMHERCYWQLCSNEHPDDPVTTVSRTRALLEDIVREQMESDVPLCTLLSGGLDSSLLTALAQGRRNAESLDPVRSFSVDFGTDSKSFVADAMRAAPDEPFVRQVVEHLGSTHRTVLVRSTEMFSDEARFAALRARDLPTLGEIDLSLLLLCRAVRGHSTVAISGEGADELFGGYRWFHDERVIGQPVFPWIAMTRELGRYSMFEPGGIALNVVEHQADMYATAVARVPVLAGESAEDRRMRELTHLHLTHFLPTPLERKDRMSMSVGLEIRVPYTDHRLVDYVFNVPWKLKQLHGQQKGLLRAAAERLLPQEIVARPKTPFPGIQDPEYHGCIRGKVSQILDDNSSPVLDLIKRTTIRTLASAPANGAPVIRMGLERILSMHEWLTTYNVALRL
jgi:asparagine synthase (glutamine-hydrolysing)